MKAKTFIFIIALAVIILFSVTAVQILRFANQTQEYSADAAIVLGAAVIDGKPSAVFEQRIAHGIRLYEAGQVRTLIFTGGIGDGDTLAESEIGRNVALAAGVPAAAILIETDSRITQQNLLEACKLMQINNLKTALIASDPLHMKRATKIAQDIGMVATPSPTTTSAYQTWRSKLPSLAWETTFYLLHITQWKHPKC